MKSPAKKINPSNVILFAAPRLSESTKQPTYLITLKLDKGGEPPDDDDMEKRVKTLNHNRTLQVITEIQKTLGELTSNIQTLTKSVESNKSKVDDLVRLKNMILCGAIMIGAIVAVLACGIWRMCDG